MGVKANGQTQPDDYVDGIVDTIHSCAFSQGEWTPLGPFWQFHTRKAIELWPKEAYREHELVPLDRHLPFRPLDGIGGPRMPVLLLQRAFGNDCFDVYNASASHKDDVPRRRVKVGNPTWQQSATATGTRARLMTAVTTKSTTWLWRTPTTIPSRREPWRVVSGNSAPSLPWRTNTLFPCSRPVGPNDGPRSTTANHCTSTWTNSETKKNSGGGKKPCAWDCWIVRNGLEERFIGRVSWTAFLWAIYLEALQPCAALGDRVIHSRCRQ